MPSSLRIAIITHQIDQFDGSGYLLNRMCEEWKKRGIGIDIIKGVSRDLPPADLAILHADITVISDDYLEVVNHYPNVINGQVKDISKTAFSDLIIDKEDGHHGPVIVKTNTNYGGMRERVKIISDGNMQGTIDVQRPWRRIEWLDEYPIFSSPADVPYGIWRNRNLVVEKFLPEQNNNGEYLVKIWVFFGDRELYYQGVSTDPVVKGHNTIRREFLDVQELPDSLRETRARLGFDFGKFDFSLIDGQAFLYDVNRTPSSPRLASGQPRISENIRMLSTGIDYFIEKYQLK